MIILRNKNFGIVSGEIEATKDEWKRGGSLGKAATILSPGMGGTFAKVRLQKNLGIKSRLGHSPLITGDVINDYSTNKRVYNHLMNTGRLDEFKSNYGKKGYRVKDIKKEMKSQGLWK